MAVKQTIQTPKIRINKYLSKRGFFLLIASIVLLGLIIIKLVDLQVINYDKYHESVVGNSQAADSELATRGIIYDAEGNKLASNSRVYTVFVDPKDTLAQDKTAVVASTLSDYFESVEYSKVVETINTYAEYYSRAIIKKIPETEIEGLKVLIEEGDLDKFIFTELTYVRSYPYGSLGANVVGFCGTDGGLSGIELQYDDYLTGTDGSYIFSRNAIGQSIVSNTSTTIDAQNGYNLNLTLKVRLQTILEEQIKAAYENAMPGEGGKVIGLCVDVNSMAVLANAQYPSYDCNDPYQLDSYSLATLQSSGLIEGSDEYTTLQNQLLNGLWRNISVSDSYEPGSTFKIITTAASLEEHAITWDTPIYCQGYLKIEGNTIHCHKNWGHKEQAFRVGLQQSCNPTLMTAALSLGKEKFFKYLDAFGYFEKTGVDMPGEGRSIYTDYESVTNTNLAYMSFGQTIKVTPLQHLRAISAVANGGYLLTPYYVESMTDSNGNVVYTHDSTPIRQVVSTEVCEQITEVLREGVATNGAARNAYVPGYKVAAKTGTSEVLDIFNENHETYLRIGSCVGYAPADDPQIACIIIVQYPTCENIYGNNVAAPYLANFFSEALPYIGVERNLTEEEEAKQSTTLRNYVQLSVANAVTDLTNRGIKYEVKGTGDTVTYQTPSGGISINKATGKVVIYCGTETPEMNITVPSLIGYSPKQAKYQITNSGLNIKYDGVVSEAKGALVVAQTPAAGTVVERGSVITITIRFNDTD